MAHGTSERETLATIFINHARAETLQYEGKQAWDKWLPLTDREILAVQPDDRNYAWYAHVASRVPSYFITDLVRDQIQIFAKGIADDPKKVKKMGDMLVQQPELFQAPFPAMWVECTTNVDQRVAGLIINRPEIKGCLAYIFGADYDKKMLIPNNIGKMCYRQYSSIAEKNHLFLGPSEKNDRVTFYDDTGNFVMTAMVFLKTRASVLHIDGPKSPIFERGKIQERMRSGKPVTKRHSQLTFDLSRIISKGFAKTEAEALKLLEEQLVGSHPKWRRVLKRDEHGQPTGGYEHKWVWWSAHFRGGTEEQKQSRQERIAVAKRDARVVLKHPDRPLMIAGLDHFD